MNELKKADRPEVVDGRTWRIMTGCGKLYVIVNRLDGEIFEVFLKGGKAGGCLTAQSETIGKLVSNMARYGIPIDGDFVIKFLGTSCHQNLGEGKAKSCADALASVIEKDIKRYKAEQPEQLEIDKPEEGDDADLGAG